MEIFFTTLFTDLSILGAKIDVKYIHVILFCFCQQSDASEAGETEHAEVTATIVDGAPVLEHEGLVAPSSSPTQTNMQENLKLHQEEALRRFVILKLYQTLT